MQAKEKFAFWQRINLPKTQEIFKCIRDVLHQKLLLSVILLFEKREHSGQASHRWRLLLRYNDAAPSGSFRRHKYLTDTCQSVKMVLTVAHGGSGGLTHTGRQGSVPHTPVPAQARQRAAAVEAVSRVARVQNMGVGEVAVVLDFVAITRDARFLAADKVKTWKSQAKMEPEANTDPSLVYDASRTSRPERAVHSL